MNKHASLIGMTAALAMAALPDPIDNVHHDHEPHVKGPTKDVRKRRKAVKKARRKNRR